MKKKQSVSRSKVRAADAFAVAVSLSQKKSPEQSQKLFPIVGIGASAGGLEAFRDLFKLLPADTGFAFVVVQHLAPQYSSKLSAILQKTTNMRVEEASDGVKVRPNHIYVIAPGFVIEVFHGVLHLRPLEENRSTNTLVDTFFSSLAKDHRRLAIGIVLSGTGSDGAQGLREIKAAGGISLVQDPKSAQYDGMPIMAIADDHPDRVLSVSDLARELVKIAANPNLRRLLSFEQAKLKLNDESDLQKIFMSLRNKMGTDFSVYKHPTILRRLRRRMILHGIETIKDYHTFLRNSPNETLALFSDLIINVTSFFRDPEAFEELQNKIFRAIVDERNPDEPVRVWVPACSTGEEVYTIAISFAELLERTKSKHVIQIYGTDVSEAIVKLARTGFYPPSISRQVSSERLKRFFTIERDGYRISKRIRDCCIFSVQDVTTDPPIHRLDLVSCRNLMIYLNATAQKKLLETFFYALNPSGFLLLGSSESVGSSASLFRVVDDRNKIYAKRASSAPPARARVSVSPAKNAGVRESTALNPLANQHPVDDDPVVAAEKLVLERYSPAWIVVNELMDVIQFRGEIEHLVSPRSGQPSWNVTKILREELAQVVQVLIHLVRKQEEPARQEGVELKAPHGNRAIDVEAVSILTGRGDRFFVVSFSKMRAYVAPSSRGETGKNAEATKLREELRTVQQTLRSFLEEQHSFNEELQSANEEILSANEELQSTNEELETAKEELQSSNEELVTVNEELIQRNAELGLINDDFANVLNNAQVAIVMINSEFAIRRLTPTAEKLFGLSDSDIGRKIVDFNLGFATDLLERQVLDVTTNLSTVEFDAHHRGGRYYSVRIRPYKTTENRIDGAVLTFVDIEEMKNRVHVAEATQQFSSAIIDTMHDPLIVLDRSLRIKRVNVAFYKMFRVNEADTIGRGLYDVGNGQWDIAEFKRLLQMILSQNTEVRDYVVSHQFEIIGQRTVLINAKRLEWKSQNDTLILLAIRDVTQVDPLSRKGESDEK